MSSNYNKRSIPENFKYNQNDKNQKISKKTMQTRLDTYRLNNPSPINREYYYDVEMAQPVPVQPQFMDRDRGFSPIQIPLNSSSHIPSNSPSPISFRSQSPIEYLNSLDDKDIKYDEHEWGFHDKRFMGGIRKRRNVKSRRMQTTRRKSKKKKVSRNHKSKKTTIKKVKLRK